MARSSAALVLQPREPFQAPFLPCMPPCDPLGNQAIGAGIKTWVGFVNSEVDVYSALEGAASIRNLNRLCSPTWQWFGMAGHVPKFDASNGGNFTETFDLAKSGRRGGSGEPQITSKPEGTTNNNPPPTRRGLPHRSRPATAPVTAPTRRPPRTNPKPVPVSEGESYGDSHIPTFGMWNVDGDQNYTGIFQAASKAKKGEVGGPALQPASRSKGSGGNGDLYKPHSKKRSSSWCCFGA